ncbi:DUF1542 domain-containing protein [Staphylococcus aureus]
MAQTADATTEEKRTSKSTSRRTINTKVIKISQNAQSIDDVNTAKDNAIQAIDPIQASTDVKTNARA